VTGYPVAKPALKIARLVLDTALTLPVSTKVPLERPNKFVTVARAGGSRPNLVTDTVRLLCQVYWLSTDLGVGNVEDTCNEAIAALQDAEGTLVLEAFIRGFDNISGPLISRTRMFPIWSVGSFRAISMFRLVIPKCCRVPETCCGASLDCGPSKTTL
jgi:hypothetical protein